MAAGVWKDVHVDLLNSRKSEREIVQQQVEAAKKLGCDDQIIICDLGDVIDKYNQWVKLMPRVKPFYAVKSNDDVAVLQVLADCGASFDCASKMEIEKLLDIGVNPSKIIYAHTCKQPSMLRHATEQGVSLMTFDNEAELFKIKTLCPDAKLILRTIPAGEFKSKIDLRLKFGCPLSQVRFLLQTAKDLGLNVIGVSFHVGSGCQHESAYSASIRQSRGVFDIATEIGFDMQLLDIGGGYPGDSDSKEMFMKIAQAVNAQLDQDFPISENVEIIAEPGTYMVSSSSILVVNVIGKRVLSSQDLCNEDENQNSKTKRGTPHVMYYINDGVYGSFQDLLVVPENLNLDVHVLKDTKDKVCYESTIWGPTCCSFDCIIPSKQLPMSKVGDWFYFRDMGAYTIVFSSGFNGMNPPRRAYFCLKDTWHKVYPEKQIEDFKMSNGFH